MVGGCQLYGGGGGGKTGPAETWCSVCMCVCVPDGLEPIWLPCILLSTVIFYVFANSDGNECIQTIWFTIFYFCTLPFVYLLMYGVL